MKVQWSIFTATYLMAAVLSTPIKVSAQTKPPGQSNPLLMATERAGTVSPEELSRLYRTAPVPEEKFQNSDRVAALTREGKVYLSLQDAIALALENNLDIELERYGPRLADSDLLRAQAGSQLRGLPLSVLEGPSGVGGPVETPPGAAPPLTPSSSTIIDTFSNQSQTDLSVTGTTALSIGPPIPAFDPTLTADVGPSFSNAPQASSFVTGTSSLITHNLTADFGLQKGFATGGALNVGYTNLRQSANSERATYNPYTTSSLGLTFTQPLLRGFGVGLNRRFIRIARNDERISDLAFRQQVITTVYNVIRLYWDLVSLQEDVRVKQQALDLAGKLLADNQARVEVGTLPALAVIQAQAQVAQARQDLSNSQSLVLEEELVLKQVLTRTGTADPKIAAARLVPTDRIEIPEHEQLPPADTLVKLALEHRPELAAGQLQVQNTEIALKGSRNSLLPSLNLVGSVESNGLVGAVNSLPLPAGSALRSPDAGLLGGYGTVLSQLWRGKFPDYGVFVQLDIPLRNRTARADLARDRLQLRQSEVRLQSLRNQVREQVEAALLAVQQARLACQAATETRALQEKALDDIRQQYEVGVVPGYNVILTQRDLAQARSNEVVTEDDYMRARAALDRATGMTLENNNVVLEEAYHGQVSRPPGALPPSALPPGTFMPIDRR
jgi:outer membrane protein